MAEFGVPPAVEVDGGFVAAFGAFAAARCPFLLFFSKDFEFGKLLVESALDRTRDDAFNLPANSRRNCRKVSDDGFCAFFRCHG